MITNDEKLNRLWDDVLTALDRGETLDVILSRYGQQLDDLTPYLSVISELKDCKEAVMPDPQILRNVLRGHRVYRYSWKAQFARLTEELAKRIAMPVVLPLGAAIVLIGIVFMNYPSGNTIKTTDNLASSFAKEVTSEAKVSAAESKLYSSQINQTNKVVSLDQAAI